jgi:hypothetical protein
VSSRKPLRSRSQLQSIPTQPCDRTTRLPPHRRRRLHPRRRRPFSTHRLRRLPRPPPNRRGHRRCLRHGRSRSRNRVRYARRARSAWLCTTWSRPRR